MFEDQIKSLSSQLNLSNDEATQLLKEAQDFYDALENQKGDKCPMAMSLSMAAQLHHMNFDDIYDMGDLLDDIHVGVQCDVIDAIANTQEVSMSDFDWPF